MSYLAGKDFVHRDLAARNILVSDSRVCKVLFNRQAMNAKIDLKLYISHLYKLHMYVNLILYIYIIIQIADFGMARDLDEGSYYVSHGGKIPVKWTAPEVCVI